MQIGAWSDVDLRIICAQARVNVVFHESDMSTLSNLAKQGPALTFDHVYSWLWVDQWDPTSQLIYWSPLCP